MSLVPVTLASLPRGVDLVVMDQGIDTSTAVGRMFFQILGSIAEFEQALMSERTRDGLAAARARDRTGAERAPVEHPAHRPSGCLGGGLGCRPQRLSRREQWGNHLRGRIGK
ncbi:recombinase family protein [Nocardia rhizosphaerihabitans]|uniref:Resolvase/invertase-type recombinase catalytic domain-containing protein n=1 Tax=Nocardia rhizosphaerihabitans TaxID=1691570 RepID=A0ABQ2K9T6_9NOCA|nr:recombinase family protein [Nocardia rhizosphaerihabitans]GGN71908.1 hypothetical protein GCM10011610_12680 [Nocardia rhizosphaerihabitans]